ncbi:MAG: GAF domain-containing protein [Nitrospiraceae bacterium]|nr:GAF domain-containing protein [Nitrospiraceae bacterium]
MGREMDLITDPLFDTFDHLGIPVFVVDEDLAVVAANAAADSVFQYSRGDMRGRRIAEFLSPAGQTGGEVLPGMPGTAGRLESTCRKKNGETFEAKASLLPHHVRGQRLLVIQDVSDRKRLSRRAAQRTKELSIFNTFAEIITGCTDVDAILRQTLDMLLRMMESDAGWVYLRDEATGDLVMQAEKGLSPAFRDSVRVLKPGECFNGKVLTSGRPLLAKKASDDPRLSRRAPGIESMAGIPIASRGTLLGVLGIASGKPSFFTAMDIQLLTTIGSQLGVAIENTRLIGQLQEKMRQIELISELSGIINSSLSIGTVFRIMVSEIRKLIGYSRASLLLFREKENNLLIFALDTEMKTAMKKGVRAPLDGTSAGWVVRNNRPWINRDLKDAEFPLDKKLFDEGIRSTISIPLYHDKILGVFNLDSTEPYHYSEKDLQVLLPAAKHISIALENALLFEEISREKKEWEKTFDAITDMVWIEDGRQRVIRANQALLAKTGYSSVEISGMWCGEILEKVGVGAVECLCGDTASCKRPSFREIKGEAGGIFHFWAYPLIDEEGSLYAIVHYLKDVTAQKRLEQQLIRSDRLASLGTLVAGIAHEINNPLGIIAGYSEALIDRAGEKTLLDNPAFEDFPEYLDTIHKEIFRCKNILMSLLDFARPSHGTFREIDINELIKEVILLVNHKAKRLSHGIQFRLNRDLPKVYADPGGLRQLFMNIIINSIYFTPERGSITISTGPDGDDEAGRPTRRIVVSVSDSGSGIPPETIDKVFNPFFTTKPVGEGTGLGLAISHKIVEEHGGTIDVESEPGRGATFFIRLPANARDDTGTGS